MYFIISTRTLLFLLLTAVTQTGGLVYLLYLFLTAKRRVEWSGFLGSLRKAGAYLLLYMVFNLTLTPLIAGYFGRTAMPIYHERQVKPANAFIWLANRHYVKQELKNLLSETALALPSNQAIIYLDANFPWFDGFPLIGHLSHIDGEKIDLAFAYTNSQGHFLNTGKSFSGYGITEAPRVGEDDQPTLCADQGHWQYSFATRFAIDQHPEYKFDHQANRRLLQALALNTSTGKIFIEPHLKTRLDLQWFKKIRFHGCHAVRHDDHIHLQLLKIFILTPPPSVTSPEQGRSRLCFETHTCSPLVQEGSGVVRLILISSNTASGCSKTSLFSNLIILILYCRICWVRSSSYSIPAAVKWPAPSSSIPNLAFGQ